MLKQDMVSDRLSLRNSVLIWVAVVVISWGSAVVVFYQLIRGRADEPNAVVAQANKQAQLVSNIQPAAGPGGDATKAAHP